MLEHEVAAPSRHSCVNVVNNVTAVEFDNLTDFVIIAPNLLKCILFRHNFFLSEAVKWQ